jgi:photosystem II stability/assembly factor-like uncharacterized protein
MRRAKMSAGRRAVLAGLIGTVVSYRPLAAMAAPTGILAIDTPSIPVKDPAEVVLIAITAVGKRLVAVGEHGVIVYSDDNGASWTQASTPVNVTLTCIAFATPLVGWAAGHYGVILHTADGGKSWQLQLQGIEANNLTLAAANAATAANDPAPPVALSVRRANHFMDDGPDNPFLTMLVFDAQNALIFGAYRMTMKTTDGGKSWADWSLHIYDQYSHNFYGALNVATGMYIVGEAGLVFRSTDGGNTFQPLAPTSDVTLFGVLAAPDGSIITYGVAGAAFRSTDDCKTWTTINLGVEDDITAGRLLRSGAVLLVSEAGALFTSKDNGATFAPVQGLRAMAIFDVQQAPAPDDDLLVVGATGISTISANLLNT